ncbi:glucosaminidase domain-containing protein [Algibacter sp. L4_22]|uniref:glucosaminidase domain-containing protein n=1 Tax=Algibacter sp. L4_22 TaxID=2942477 RepID=UPI00201B7484|nr:glucosaminidase domain-containing protein [Algibacter sp. L4_22]MCL5127675.1 glucosaminidase domain-containing protein [Algibacter sp. L4_22]
MNRVLILLCVVVVSFSCKSKKTVVTKKRKTKTERVTKKTEGVKTATRSSYTNATEEYIANYADVAVAEMEWYNIPASITLAQGILESASGNGRLSKEANNHFGIKCHDWDGDRIYHDDDAAQECFRKYDDAKNSFRDHSLFLTERNRYSGLFKLKKTDYKSWARGLRAAGYATDPKYPAKLISLIERYNLDQYDGGRKSSKSNSDFKQRDEIVINAKTNVVSVRDVPKVITHVVVKGDTLYYIAKMHNISVPELKAINDLEDNNIKIGQELQVSPK